MKSFIIGNASKVVLFSSLVISGAFAYANEPVCGLGHPVPVSGEITNNLQAGGAFSTLGVVALKLGYRKKMKCGLVGEPAVPEFPGGIAFTHTLSCDDKVLLDTPSGALVAHSQLTLDTQGQLAASFCNGIDPSQGVFGPFQERSVPKNIMGNSTGRGLFTGVTEGEIFIEGEINCAGSVDMAFEGYICMIRSRQASEDLDDLD